MGHHWMLHLYFWIYSTATKLIALKFGGNKECRSPRLNVQFLSENVCPSCFNWTFNFWCNISWWMTVLLTIHLHVLNHSWDLPILRSPRPCHLHTMNQAIPSSNCWVNQRYLEIEFSMGTQALWNIFKTYILLEQLKSLSSFLVGTGGKRLHDVRHLSPLWLVVSCEEE